MDHTDGENEKKGKKVLFALTNVCIVLKNRSNAKCVERKPSQGDERANSNRISVCQLEIPDTKNEIKARSIEVVSRLTAFRPACPPSVEKQLMR